MSRILIMLVDAHKVLLRVIFRLSRKMSMPAGNWNLSRPGCVVIAGVGGTFVRPSRCPREQLTDRYSPNRPHD